MTELDIFDKKGEYQKLKGQNKKRDRILAFSVADFAAVVFTEAVAIINKMPTASNPEIQAIAAANLVVNALLTTYNAGRTNNTNFILRSIEQSAEDIE